MKISFPNIFIFVFGQEFDIRVTLSIDVLGLLGEGEARSAEDTFKLEDKREEVAAGCEVKELREFEGKTSKDIIE